MTNPSKRLSNTIIFGYDAKYYLFLLAGMIGLSFFAAIWIGLLQGFRVVFGTLYALFLPGFLLSHLFFDKLKIDILERIALSFALSISVIPLLVFYLNLAGLRVSTLNSVLTVFVVSLLSLAWLVWKKKI